MRFFYILRIIAVLTIATLAAGSRAEAQAFGLGVTNAPTSLGVSNLLTYSISVTNLSLVLLSDVVVSNVLPASIVLVQVNIGQGTAAYYTNASTNVLVFDLGAFVYPGIAQMSFTVRPTVAGPLTNTITVAAPGLLIVPVSTNVVNQVTNAVVLTADLGVAMTGPTQAIIVNDLMTYSVAATNYGTNSAPNVTLTNTLPPGVTLKSISPSGQPHTVVSSNLIFNLGTMAVGARTNLQFTVQPANAGVLNFSASIGSSSRIDPNPTNNFASTNITILNYLSGPLFVVTNSPQTINYQNGLTEQSILLSNNVGTNVLAVRVVVTNLTKQLFNSVGVNNGNPYVVLNTELPAGQSVKLLLQFSPRGDFPLANSQLQAFAVPVMDFAPPKPASTSKLLNISHIVPLANGTVLIEFPTVLGKTYTVVYSDNASFSNAAIAPPSFVAPASQSQWIDYGPPTTTSAPTNVSSRFYRVFLNP